jgi:hypothetical protein
MKEATLWTWFREKARVLGWHVVRIESSTQLGIPDVNYAAPNGTEGWVELKVAPRLKRNKVPAWQHELTVQQEEFLLQRARRRSSSGILCQVEKERFFVPAGYAARFNELTIDELKSVNQLEAIMRHDE